MKTWSTFRPWPCGVRAYDPPFTGSDGTVAIAIDGVEHKFEHKSCLTIGSEQLWDTFPGPRTKHHQTLAQRQQNKGETTRREAQRKRGRCKHSRRNILPGCGEYNGDAHRETLIVDTALQSICVQLKLDVPRHGISQQEQPKNIIDVHSSCRRSSSKELSDDA